MGRKYRSIVWRGEVLELGPYWEGSDELTELRAPERETVMQLLCEAATRFSSPLVGVDVGQAVGGRWWVIETSDPQFAGTSQLRPLVIWHRLFERLVKQSR